MRSTEAFKAFYESELKKELIALDEVRKRYMKFNSLFLLGFFLAVAIVVWVKYQFQPRAEIIIGLVLAFAVALIIVGVYVYKETKDLNYKQDFKNRIIKSIVHFISEDLMYKANQKISPSNFKKSRLFLSSIDRYRGDDYVAGKIDQTAIQFSELHVQYKTTSNNSKGQRQTRWHTVFKGLFFQADFNKDFEGSTVLLPNYLGKKFTFFKKIAGATRKEKYVKLEDTTFNENFNCYSTDDIKARYILSPALMQRINSFKDNYPKNPVSISFVDGAIYVAISYSKDLFEPTYFSSLVKRNMMLSYFEDIKLVVDIVEELNLNTRIWSKE